MLSINEAKRFKKSFKKISQYKNYKQEKMDLCLSYLLSEIPLPKSYKDHELSGKRKGERECHLSPDILLVYRIEKEILILELLDIGNHSTLFK